MTNSTLTLQIATAKQAIVDSFKAMAAAQTVEEYKQSLVRWLEAKGQLCMAIANRAEAIGTAEDISAIHDLRMHGMTYGVVADMVESPIA